MFIRFRSARPTNDLTAIERFYVEALRCIKIGSFVDHQGFDGVILSSPDNDWQIEFLFELGVVAPRAPTNEHLFIFYVESIDVVSSIADRMHQFGFSRVTPNNPYWERHGMTFEDPDGYHVVVATLP